MSNLSIVVFTYNEVENVKYNFSALDSLGVKLYYVDSFSNDGTYEYLTHLGANVLRKQFKTFSEQRNFALESHEVEGNWLLILDADEQIDKGFVEELERITTKDNYDSASFGFDFYFQNQKLKFLRHPRRIRFVKRELRFSGNETSEYLVTKKAFKSKKRIRNNDQADIQKQIEKQITKAKKFNSYVTNISENRLRLVLKRLFLFFPKMLRPFLQLFVALFISGGIFDGTKGIKYAFIYRFLFHFMVALLKK